MLLLCHNIQLYDLANNNLVATYVFQASATWVRTKAALWSISKQVLFSSTLVNTLIKKRSFKQSFFLTYE